jgi:hypothetical protein
VFSVLGHWSLRRILGAKTENSICFLTRHHTLLSHNLASYVLSLTQPSVDQYFLSLTSPAKQHMTPYQKKHAVNDDGSTVVTALTTGTSSLVHMCKVRFSLESNQSFPIPHITDMEDEEFLAIWYGPRDYKRIKIKIFLILRKMKNGEQIEDNDKQSVRGLECRTVQGANLRQENKLMGMTAVLDEQDRHYEDGEQNDELLAEVYRNTTSHCQDEAYALGLKDQAEIQEELDTMRREPISSLQKSTDSKTSSGINGLLKQVGPSRLALPAVAHKMGVLGAAA